MSLGNETRMTIQPRSVSDNIVLTSNMVKSALLPLINLYGDRILIVANTSDRLVLETPGNGIPNENVVDEKIGNNKLQKVIREFNSKNKNNQNNKHQPKKESPRDDLKAGVPVEREVSKEEIIVPEVTVIKENKQ